MIFLKKSLARETEVERGSFVSAQSSESTLFKELTQRYITEALPKEKSQRKVTSQLNIIKAELGNYSVAALTPQIVAQFRDNDLLLFQGVRQEKTY